MLIENQDSNEWGYCDPCWNAEYYQEFGTMPFMLMGSDEIKQTHTLSLEEQNISIASNSYRREMITKETAYAVQKYQNFKKEIMKKYAEKKSRQTEERDR